MPKLKSKSGAKKRFKKTASGFKYASTGRRHILTKKSTKRKRQLRTTGRIGQQDMLSVERMMRGS